MERVAAFFGGSFGKVFNWRTLAQLGQKGFVGKRNPYISPSLQLLPKCSLLRGALAKPAYWGWL